MNYVMCNI